ncbi:MAG TPA: hypothetical protein VMU41_04855 [Candidatus Binataceae bacterium]|nr:hypothetical protein [Candidatus Binataceae bacterium]
MRGASVRLTIRVFLKQGWVLIAAIIAFAMPFFAVVAHAAKCSCECADEYRSDVDLCQTVTKNDPIDDDVRSCVENARDDYNTCVRDCSDPLDLSMR